MVAGYYLLVDGKPTGPFSVDELKAHELPPSSQVRPQGGDGWVRADSLAELRRAIHTRRPLPPPPEPPASPTQPTAKAPPPAQTLRQPPPLSAEFAAVDEAESAAPRKKAWLAVVAICVLAIGPAAGFGVWYFVKDDVAAGGRNTANTGTSDNPQRKSTNERPQKTLARKNVAKSPAVVAAKTQQRANPVGKAPAHTVNRAADHYLQLAGNLSLDRLFASVAASRRVDAASVAADCRSIAETSRSAQIAAIARKAESLWRGVPARLLEPPDAQLDDAVALLTGVDTVAIGKSVSGSAEQSQRAAFAELLAASQDRWKSIAPNPRLADLSIQVTEKDGSIAAARLQVRNDYDRPLTHCTVVVELSDARGGSIRNYFYFDQWPDGRTLELTPGLFWDRTGLVRTQSAKLSVYSDRAVQIEREFQFPDRTTAIVQAAIAAAEKRLAQAGEYEVAGRVAGKVLDIVAQDSRAAKSAQALSMAADKLAAQHKSLMDAIKPDRRFAGRWSFGKYSSSAELLIETRSDTGVQSSFTAHLHDPTAPTTPKRYFGRLQFDRDLRAYELQMTGVKSPSIVAIEPASRPQVPALANLLRKDDERRFLIAVAANGDLTATSSAGDLLQLIPQDAADAAARIAALKDSPAQPLVDADRCAPLPKSLLNKPGSTKPVPLPRAANAGEMGRIWTGQSGGRVRSVDLVWFAAETPIIYWLRGKRELIAWNIAEKKRVFARTASLPLAQSPDDKLLASAAFGVVELFDATKHGRPVRKVNGACTALALADRTLVGGTRTGQVFAWTNGGRKTLQAQQPSPVTAVTATSSGRFVLSAGIDGKIHIWPIGLRAKSAGSYDGHPFAPFRLLISADDRRVMSISPARANLAAAAGEQSQQYLIHVWDLKTREKQHELTLGVEPTHIDISADWRYALLAEADGRVTLWDLTAGRELNRFVGHQRRATSVAFSPDGRFALSGGRDQWVILWSLPTAYREPASVGPRRPGKTPPPKTTPKPSTQLTAAERKQRAVQYLRLAKSAARSGRAASARRSMQQARSLAGDDATVKREIDVIEAIIKSKM